MVGDLTEAGPAQALVDRALEQLGQVDILVNVVGGGPSRIVSISSGAREGISTSFHGRTREIAWDYPKEPTSRPRATCADQPI